MTNGTTNAALEKSLPSSYYYAPEMFAREKERIFVSEWFCAGREEDLPLPGTVLVREVLGESILIARTKEVRSRPTTMFAAIVGHACAIHQAKRGGE